MIKNMKQSKNISLFKIAFFLIINILIQNIFLYIISLILLFILNKKDLLIFIFLFLLTIFISNFNHLINIGYINTKENNYIIVDSIIYKSKIYTTKGEVGDFVFVNNLDKSEDEKLLKNNILYIGHDDIEIIGSNIFIKFSNNRINSFEDNIKNICQRILLNKYVDDDLLNVIYGFSFYYLLKLIFKKNKHFSFIILIIYSIFFGFQIKFFLIIIDYFLSFKGNRNLDVLALKLIFISLINIHLLFNYSIFISLLFSLINLLKFNNKIIISMLQSLLFGNINLFLSFFYKYFIIYNIFLFIFTFILFIFPNFIFIYKIIEIIINLFRYLSIEIRGKISINTIIIFILFSLIIKNKTILHLLLILCLLLPINNPYAHISFIDVGQGDSILIKGKFNTYNILIDTGSKYNYGQLKKELINEGIYKIDYLIITHNDSDHNGNIDNLKNDFEINKIIEKPQDIVYKDLYLNNIYLGTYDNDNDNSLIYYLIFDNYTFLFTGDISSKIEKELIDYSDLDKIDVLKVAHHGSKTATTDLFLKKTMPLIAVISTSGQYNHPSKEVIERLSAYQVKTYITKEKGTISIYFTRFIDFVKTGKTDFDIIFS